MTAASSAHFSIAIGRALGTVVVTVGGDLDPTAAEQLRGVLADLIDGQGNMTVVVDLNGARVADAGALSVFIGGAERAARRGGSLTLSDPPEILYEALILRGLGALVRSTRHDGQRQELSGPPISATRPREWARHPARARHSDPSSKRSPS